MYNIIFTSYIYSHCVLDPEDTEYLKLYHVNLLKTIRCSLAVNQYTCVCKLTSVTDICLVRIRDRKVLTSVKRCD